MTEADKTISVLIAMNVLVFGAWRVPRLQPFMNRYFVHSPTSGRYITLLTSSFSQRQATHLALNMVGLWTIGPWIYDTLGREQFIALYLSLGVGSNTISHVAQLALYPHRPIIPSLGSSGAIYGLLSGTAVMYPESAVFIAFLPTVPIKIR
jgi:rhomboid-like protein